MTGQTLSSTAFMTSLLRQSTIIRGDHFFAPILRYVSHQRRVHSGVGSFDDKAGQSRPGIYATKIRLRTLGSFPRAPSLVAEVQGHLNSRVGGDVL
jgi:hypothetical protein